MITITKKDFVIDIGKYKIYRCSNCKEQEIRNDFKFCPVCGEKLRFKIMEEVKK